MHAARPYVMAAAALAATGTVAVTPVASRLPEIPVASHAVSLVDSSMLNIPLNLLYDFANLPYNEIQALNGIAGSLFFTGTWWVPSSTNLWGIDPGDPTHVALILGLLGLPELTGGEGGLGYQIDGLLAAELPVSDSCDAETCFPMTPPNFITGSTMWDRNIGFLQAASGQTPFGLFDNWFKVPISDLINGYTFNPTDDPGAVSPSGPVIPGFGYENDDSNPFIGGTVWNEETGQYDMPWNGLTYQLNLFQPFVNYYNSLLETPATDGDIPGTGIMLPTGTDFIQALQNLAAGMIIDFNAYTAGSPACPALCDIPANMQIPALVEAINNMTPGGTPMINEWLAAYAAGQVNEPTQDQINTSIALLQTGIYNLTPEQLTNVNEALASINPELPALYANAGIFTDPAYLEYSEAIRNGMTPPEVLEPVYGGYNPNLVGADLLAVMNAETDYSKLLDINLLGEILFPAASNWTAAPMDPAAGVDPAALLNSDAGMGADLGNLAALLGTTSLTDMLNSVVADLTAQLQADLSALASSFGADLPVDFMSGLPDLLAMF